MAQTYLFRAPHSATTSDVVALVYDSLYSDRDDANLARELSEVAMREQLSFHLVKFFRYIGLGPKALAALEKLQAESAAMQAPQEQVILMQPIPSRDERRRTLKLVSAYALGYVKALPNFLCIESTDRYTNLSRVSSRGRPYYDKKLHHGDTTRWGLRFVDGVESGNQLREQKNEERAEPLRR